MDRETERKQAQRLKERERKTHSKKAEAEQDTERQVGAQNTKQEQTRKGRAKRTQRNGTSALPRLDICPVEQLLGQARLSPAGCRHGFLQMP